MKRIYIAMTAIAAVTMVSCQQEKSFDDKPLGKDEFRIALQGSASTRSQELNEPKTFSYLAGKDEASGLDFYLEETVEDLNAAWTPATKGTPVYTENVGKLYHNMNVVAKGGTSDINTHFWAMDDAQRDNAGWRYQGTFTWAKDSYDFYMSMPEDMTSNGVSGLTPGKEDNKLKYTFSYTSPSTATSQQDIIFAARNITKEEAETNRVEGVPVLFHHALTGVKFRIANNDVLEKGKDGHTQTYITKVTISGLKNSGTCTIIPREETTGYVDDRTNDYSSGDQTFTSGVVAWNYNDGTGTFSQTFTEAQNVTKYSSSTTATGEDGEETTTSGSFTNNGNYPDTFSNAGNTYNLNDGDASMTFWFIPQALTEKVTLTVEFHVWDGTKNQKTNELTLNLGTEVLKKTGNDLTLTRDWKAGQIRTFSLKPQHVDVEIEDELEDYVKSDVTIRNTGNVAQYVRVYITGNWVGKRQIAENKYNTDETVLMGYTSGERNDDGTYKSSVEVARWNDKDFRLNGTDKVYEDWTSPAGVTYTYTPFGEFVDLPPMGTKTAGGTAVHNWVRHDKFYYYTLPIGPGAQVPASDPLFTSYTVGKSPDFWIADNTGVRRLADNVHLVMDLMVQAIEAPIGNDGKPTKSYLEAWTEALNPTGAADFNINDL